MLDNLFHGRKKLETRFKSEEFDVQCLAMKSSKRGSAHMKVFDNELQVAVLLQHIKTYGLHMFYFSPNLC